MATVGTAVTVVTVVTVTRRPPLVSAVAVNIRFLGCSCPVYVKVTIYWEKQSLLQYSEKKELADQMCASQGDTIKKSHPPSSQWCIFSFMWQRSGKNFDTFTLTPWLLSSVIQLHHDWEPNMPASSWSRSHNLIGLWSLYLWQRAEHKRRMESNVHILAQGKAKLTSFKFSELLICKIKK